MCIARFGFDSFARFCLCFGGAAGIVWHWQLFTDDYFPLGLDVDASENNTGGIVEEPPYVTWGEWKGKAWKHPKVVQKLRFLG